MIREREYGIENMTQDTKYQITEDRERRTREKVMQDRKYWIAN